MSYPRVTHDDRGNDGSSTDAAALINSHSAGLEAVEAFVSGTAYLTRATGDALYGSGQVNAKDPLYGATGDGVTDDTAAIQAAINAAMDAGSDILIPPGTYVVSSSLVIGAAGSVTQGIRLVGGGVFGTILKPTAAFGSSPVVKIVNGRRCEVTDLYIKGHTTAPRAGIELHTDTPGNGSPAVSLCAIRRVSIGGLSQGDSGTVKVVDGIRVTHATGYDGNNDYIRFDDVMIGGFSGIGISFESKNSVCNVITGGQITGGPVAVGVMGGSFTMYGTGIGELSDCEFDFKEPITSAYSHQSSIIGVQSEYSTTDPAAALLRTTDDAGIDVAFIGYERYGSKPTLTIIDYASAGKLALTACRFNLGQAGQTAQFTDPHSDVSITGCTLQFTSYLYHGRLSLQGNTHLSTPTLTASDLGKLERFADYDQGSTSETPNDMRRIDTTKKVLQAGYPSDTVPRYSLQADGTQAWGAGGASAPDVVLYRDSANVLQTEDALYSTRANGTDVAALARITGDSSGRWYVLANGTLLFTSGSAGPDVKIYRSAADTLTLEAATKTILTGGLQVNGSLGFYGTTPTTKPNITGSRGGNAALADLLTKLAALGLITDGTS